MGTRILDILNMRIKNFRKRNGLDELKYIAFLEYREDTVVYIIINLLYLSI